MRPNALCELGLGSHVPGKQDAACSADGLSPGPGCVSPLEPLSLKRKSISLSKMEKAVLLCMVMHAFNPKLRRQRQPDHFEFQVSLVNLASSSTARAKETLSPK